MFRKIIFLILTAGTGLVGQNLVRDRAFITQGIELTINQRYGEAETHFRKLIRIYPDHPAGYFYTAAVIQAWMMDYETHRREKEFYELVNQAIFHSEKILHTNPRSAEAYFFHGSAFGYQGIHQSRKKEWISAFNNGLKGVKDLEKCIALDSSYYDAYMAVGTYQYWRSRLTRFLFWVPFVHDQRAEGIRLLKISAEKGTFSPSVAISNLAWIQLDAGKYTEAIDWAKKGSQKFPASRFFLWVWGYAAQRGGKYEEARIVFEKILTSVQKETFNNHYNEIESHYKLAEIYNSLHQPETACKHLQAIKRLSPDPDVKYRLKNRLAKTDVLLKSCPVLTSP